MQRRAFTLVEMMVVIGVSLLLVGLAYPVLSTMQNMSRVEGGVNAVSVAAEAAKAYTTSQGSDLSDPLPQYGNGFEAWRVSNGLPNGTVNFPGGGGVGGCAMIFTPSGEIRLVQSDPTAETPGGVRLSAITSGGNPAPRVGYRDIPERDYITIPDGVIAQGIRRGGPTGSPEYLDPPFAVRFDEHGQLIAYDSTAIVPAKIEHESLVVIYDGDHDGDYNVADNRPGGYSVLSAPSPAYDNRPEYQRYELPFERLETVVGVRIIDARWYAPAEPDGIADGAPDNAYTYVMFGRYTGSAIRNR